MLRFSSTLLLAAACLLVSTGAERVTTCGDHVHRLSCDAGAIHVEETVYGRKDGQICSGGKNQAEVANTDCSLQGAVDTLKQWCEGKKVCEINSHIFNADPCSDTFKYLDTKYTCVRASQGQVISVIHADFGRSSYEICSFRRDLGRLENIHCSNPAPEIGERCNGKNSCSVRVGSWIFEDTCPNMYKYLEVAYTCQCK
ncbi:L-rhamnose-binding lectin SML-like [Pholidichthys leucotaenia]